MTTLSSTYVDDDNEDDVSITNDNPEVTPDQHSNTSLLTATSETRSQYGRIIQPPLRYRDQDHIFETYLS